ncbi:MAG: hypothetical protein AMXMBFR13_22970 [Phycisphaerae bacterium]
MTRREECQLKQQSVAHYLESRQLEAVVLTRRVNFAWFTSGGLNHVSTAADVGASSLLVSRERVLCLTNSIEAPRIIAEELGPLGIEVKAFAWHDPAEAAREWAAHLGDRHAACDAPVAGLPGTVTLLSGDFDALRWQLTEGEVAKYRILATEVAEALECACRQVRPGMTEHALAGNIGRGLLERGIRAPVILVAADERVRQFRHPLPTGAKFHHYGMGVCTGERDGLHVSVTRLFSFGTVDADLRRRHEAVCAVDTAIMATTRPERTFGEIFAVAQRAYADTGFPDEWKLHHQGGSTGYSGREVRATPGNSTKVASPQAFAWNPSIAGTKSEDTLLILPDRNEILSLTGHWPSKMYTADGQTSARNQILEL